MYWYSGNESSGLFDGLPRVPSLALEIATNILSALPAPFDVPLIPEPFYPRLCGLLRIGKVGRSDPEVEKEMLGSIRVYR